MKQIPHKMDPALAKRARGLNPKQMRLLGDIYMEISRNLMRSAREMRAIKRKKASARN
jgi:hypothetical protein